LEERHEGVLRQSRVLRRPEDLLNSIQLEWRSAAGASNPVDGLIVERRREAAREDRK